MYNTPMKKPRPLPLGSQTFSYIIEQNAVYVDKTPFLYELISGTVNKYFLSRPRRFGKSLTISTLKGLFLGQKVLFKDLYITKETNYDFPAFPVFHFDFSEIGHQTAAELSKILIDRILMQARRYGCTVDNTGSIPEVWGNTLQFFKQKQQKIVILIDEYDKPILDHITNLPIAKENRDVLKSFYEIIKANDESLRFVFITGITKFSQMNVFSGMNNLTDISLNPDYAALCGYTQDELETCFSDYLDVFAMQEHLDKPALLEKIKTWYNGFRFTKSPITVYNPYSTLSMLAAKTFQYHWFATGTPTYLVQLIQQLNIDVQSIPKKLSINDTASYNVDSLQVNLAALLFQTGYTTIVGVSSSGDTLLLDYPNLEVKEAFNQQLIDMLARPQLSPAVTIDDLREALYQNNLAEVFRIITLFFAKIPYDIQEGTENYYQSLFYLIFTVIGTRIRAEVRTHHGRIDALVETETHVYVFEFKLLRNLNGKDSKALRSMSHVEGRPLGSRSEAASLVSASAEALGTQSPEEKTPSPDAQRALAAAMAQIDSKDYALSFQDRGKTIVKVAVVFSVQERNIAAWMHT